MFDELERVSKSADPLGASAFPEVSGDSGEDEEMGTLEPTPETELGFGERFSKEEEEVPRPTLSTRYVS